ncbi:metallo-hydrolase [Penicillium argentinense]|uniref:Metallo-hydrolase n=1 Tax=Penicillium argentinense TaxID=1131581 RepID=A0A9W9EXK8_9EURO|nr:metallo-hydrolase [Penicillium argentinense]KAJ5089868.1 metallo-hydrolase [Penicillium argentinense]
MPTIHNLFEPVTGTWQFIVADPSTLSAVIIDPVLDYEPATQVITTTAADALLAYVKEKGYKIERILETHVHADHLTSSSYLQHRLSQTQGFKPPIGIGKRITQVQNLFGRRYQIGKEEYEQVFDNLFEDDESFAVGELTATALHLPGHTPDHLGYKIGGMYLSSVNPKIQTTNACVSDNVICGDSLFHADIGTARCDFPGGDAKNLFKSGRRLLDLDEHVKIWPGHDYPPPDREPVPFLTVGEHRRLNRHIKDSISEEQFVKMRTERDASLKEPRLLHQSLQVNVRGGRLPAPTESGQRMLHLPLKLNGLEW